MARTVRSQELGSRAARLRKPASHEPYWAAVAEGMHLGYRKGAKSASWIARFRGKDGSYRKAVIAQADDVLDADGIRTLSFAQAQERARAWFATQAKVDAGIVATDRCTVAQAVEDYLAWFRPRRRSVEMTTTTVNAFILPEFGKTELSRLTTNQIRKWHEQLASDLPRSRGASGSKPGRRSVDLSDPEVVRRRRSTANRILTVLKAVLNHAFREGRAESDAAWRRVRPFRSVDGTKIRFLNEDEIRRLVAASPPDLADLVRAALFTGCRYGELASLQVGDFDPAANTIHIRQSKSGQPRHVFLSDEAARLFVRLCEGRERSETLLLDASGSPWRRWHQHRPIVAACAKAGIKPAISFHILRHTHASQLALRGTPLMVIAAQLGHADTRMAERHYAHLTTSYVAQTIRTNLPTLGI